MKRGQRIRPGRRAFFRSVAGLGVVAGTGVLLARQGPLPARDEPAAAPGRSTAYRETEHIRRYYQTARG